MVQDATWIVLATITVYRCLVRNHINRKPKEVRETYLKFKEYAPGYLHIDVTYLPRIDVERKYLFVAIDRATRLLFYLVYDGKAAENAADFLDRCRELFPFGIKTILTDNGKEFSNRLFKGKAGSTTDNVGLFDQACGNTTEHRLTKQGTPKTNGMVERANLTIKSATIHRSSYISHDELSESLSDFLLHYNLHRRHGGLVKELKVRTPIEACIKWFETQPELFLQPRGCNGTPLRPQCRKKTRVYVQLVLSIKSKQFLKILPPNLHRLTPKQISYLRRFQQFAIDKLVPPFRAGFVFLQS